MVCYQKHDAEKSLSGFEKFTLPALRTAFGTNEIFSTERHENRREKDLDFAGIDGFFVTVDGWQYFFASRVQFGKNFETFTIRRSRPRGATTEYDKILHARQIQAPVPTFHVQTFVSEDGLSAVVGIVETVDLLKYIGEHQDQWRTAPTGETFYFVPWQKINAQIFRVDALGHVEKKNAA